MTSKVMIERLSTGVPGFDAILGGGLPEFSFNLIAGAPGCGKTTLAHQLMFAMANADRPALYFTVLGEPPLKMLRYQQQFEFFDNVRIGTEIRFINLGDVALTADLDQILDRVAAEVRSSNPAFVFIDSFRSIVPNDIGGTGAEREQLRRFVDQLGAMMANAHVTMFLIGEFPATPQFNPVFTIADGIVWLRQSVHRNSMVRKLEIAKMRGQPTMPGLHSFRIDNRGLRVFAPAVPGAPPDPGVVQQRLSMGVPDLDAMLGGGLPRGHSLLVAGPSGSGKSILAAAFLAEGARLGECGVIAAFEQRAERSRPAALVELIASGRVGLVDSRPPDLSIDEIVIFILQAIHRLDAKRVVIDSLSGFELALAPTFRDDFRASLSRMVTTLAGTGVTVLMTSELEDRYTDLRFSPYGTAFLTDSIIVQRYVEVESRLLRVMAVVKVRASAHSNELRQYTIDDAGIHLGNSMPAVAGLLSGRPIFGPSGAAGSDPH